MEDFLNLVLVIWVIFMVGGMVIIATYMIWDCLRNIFKGEI